MKKLRFLLPLIGLMAFSGCSNSAARETGDDYLGPDNTVYEEAKEVDFNMPDQFSPKRAVNYPSKVTLHYHNDDGGNNGRAFYVWFSGINGEQYSPDHITNEGKDMDITFDFTKPEYQSFARRRMFIIIKKNIVDNWDDKSDDTEISFEEFPPNANGLTEIWIIPGEGSVLELYASQEETQMDRVLSANMSTSWKGVDVISTIMPEEYRLYAFTGAYLRADDSTKKLTKKNYMIKSGQPTGGTNYTFNDKQVKKWSISLNHTIHINVQYAIETIYSTRPNKVTNKYISLMPLYETPRFEKYYQYDGDDLGATWNGNSTTFKVWAPTAGSVRLNLYKNGTPSSYEGGSDEYSGYNMFYQPGGIWSVTITNKNLSGSYYQYEVYNSLGRKFTSDPYAKACGINGERSEVLDFSITNPTGWDNVPSRWDGVNGYDIANPNSLTVYEAHIRDLTMDKTWNGTSQPGTFTAYIESGTTYTDGNDITVRTGFDHLRDMGFNAIQLTPVFDYDNTEIDYDEDGNVIPIAYNWGYNPLNYNCVEGGYSTDPFTGHTRIKEFKQLIQAFADTEDESADANHTRVIMDVVYNHVQSAPASCFNKLMPGYYFRMINGNYYNGSGCGNEVKSEAPMMRKYIVDSLCWWASEYKIKGFRFDLMGLIDWKTINEARKELYKIDPDIYLYGEGWTGDGSDSGHVNEDYYGCWGSNSWTVYNVLYPQENMCDVGCFNDAFRDALRGGNNHSNTEDFKGLISTENPGDRARKVADGLIGYHTGKGGNPNQCINYASCHDNFALFDQLTATIGADGQNQYYPGVVCAASAAAECTVLFSNGIAFIQGGEEMFRSKEVRTDADKALAIESKIAHINGKIISHDSYNLSDDVNSYKWDRLISVEGTDVRGYVQSIKDAIKLRRELPKYDYEAVKDGKGYDSNSPINVWSNLASDQDKVPSGSTTLGMKNGDYFFFLNGCSNNAISFDVISKCVDKFCSNPYGEGYTRGDKSITLGWATCVGLLYVG